MRRLLSVLVCLALGMCLTPLAPALVNPSVQPGHFWLLFRTVLTGQILSVADDGSRAELRVDTVCKGEFTTKTFIINSSDPLAKEMLGRLRVGETFVAWAGKNRASAKYAFLLYSGVRARWLEGTTSEDGTAWTCSGAVGGADDSDGIKTLHGTWNGHSAQLARMVKDQARGVAFFPSTPFDHWNSEQDLTQFDTAITAVALDDLDGDGRLDVIAASAHGIKMLHQESDHHFSDVTATCGLADVPGTVSVSLAPFAQDTRPALLIDAHILRWNGARYVTTNMLPADTGTDLINALFVDADGDGRADVLISRRSAGLHLWHNDGDHFSDITAASGLNKPDQCASGSGKVCCGDWNGDGRMDLFYATGKGFLFIQDDKHQFITTPLNVAGDFSVDGDDDTARTGGGSFAPLAQDDRTDLSVARESGSYLFSQRQGRILDVTGEGNELADGGFRLSASVAEDLNADGRCDLIMLSSTVTQPQWVGTNRGYGSWMRLDKVDRKVFASPAFAIGAGAAAVGDVDGDGANDLLMGGVDGTLRLVINGVLDQRTANESSTEQQQILARTAILSVALPMIPGALGAAITLKDADDTVIAIRHAGSGASVGSAGPLGVNIAVREPGNKILHVRWSDGLEKSFPVTLIPGKTLRCLAER